MTDDVSRFRNLELDDHVAEIAAAPASRSGLSISQRPGTVPNRPAPHLAREADWLSNATLRDFQRRLAKDRQSEAVRRQRTLGVLLPIGLTLGASALFLSARLAPQSVRTASETAAKATTVSKPSATTHTTPHVRHHRRHTTKR